VGFFSKNKRLVYDQLLVLPANEKCPAAFRPDIDIDVTSHSESLLFKQLSPFVLGYVQVDSGLWSLNLENAWQYSKVFAEHLDEQGEPSDEWFAFRDEGFARKNAVHFPMGRGAKHKYAYYNGEKLGAFDARVKMFIPWYLELAKETEAWSWLEAEYRAGKRILLRDFGAIDNIEHRKTFDQCLADPHTKLCHGYILASALLKLT